MRRITAVMFIVLAWIAALSLAPLMPSAAQGPQPDGTIESLELYAQTENVDYYRMLYWSDGLRIAGFYAEPNGPGPYPAVIYNRGGARRTGALRGWEIAPFAEAGMIVVASQYRGGPGSEGFDQFGGDDVHDVLNLITLLRNRPKVDQGRLVMFGSSRGAMMTYITLRLLAERGTNEIMVAATTSGLSDLFMWADARSDLNRSFYPDIVGATTRGNPDAFVHRSATYWPYMIRVPLLMVHGDGDADVSVEQSRRLFDGMRAAGMTVELTVLPGGDHGLNNYEGGMQQVLRWFHTYLRREDQDFTYETHREAILDAIAQIRGR
ncbi:MAG: S9 family peptidase [Anaerolineae bacterium]|nr:S9 family peptidase [Anaerolineae bacterium]